MPALRQLTERELAIIGKYSAQHGQVRGFEQSVADDNGAISLPLLRVPLLLKLEHRGAISRQQAEAGCLFHMLFQRAALDALRAADMGRVPMPPGTVPRDPSASVERCRQQVSAAMTALGGAGSVAASIIWHCCGLEWSPHRWAQVTRRHHDFAHGCLAAALAALASHFAGTRRAR